MKHSRNIVRLLTILSISGFLLCSGGSDIAGGGGTRGGNPVLAGIVVDSTGQAVLDARVGIAVEEYDPLDAEDSNRYVQTRTDARGRFAVTAPGTGALYVTAWDSGRTHSGFVTAGANEKTDTVAVPDLRITRSGTLVVRLPIAIAGGRAALTGTNILAETVHNDSVIVFTGVPRGLSADVSFRSEGSPRSRIIVEDLEKSSADRDTLVVDAVKSFSRQIVLNTTSDGADIAQTVQNVPILIRLDSTHTRVFEEASKDQIWFRKNDVGLPVRVETWDPAARSAALWVRVDSVRGNNTTDLTMYWGEVPAVQNTAGEVFDTANGFVGVYHLSDPSPGQEVLDATQASRHGKSVDASVASVPVKGIIGGAQQFGEKTKPLEFPTPALSDGNWTMSAWFLPNGPINQGRIVGDSTGGVRLSYGSSFEPSLQRNAKVHLVYSEGDPKFLNLGDGPLDDSWHYISATCDTSKQSFSLYIDGALVGDVTWTTGTVSVPSPTTYIGGGYVESFIGLIDEVRIARTPRSPEWLKLCYENQRPNSRLVEFR